jgi:Hemerythrin HHE cation binding domain
MTQTHSGGTDTSDMPAVHRVFRSSLAAGPDFVASAAGNSERRSLIANYYVNLIEFLEVHHDGEEVLVFPLLSERAPDHQDLLHEAEKQHADVVALMSAVKASMTEWEATGDAMAPDAVESLHALDEVLIPHLDQEELAILPLASQHLNPEEWGKLPGHAMGNFSGDKIWLILGLIRENFTQAQRDSMLEHMPPPARQMWESMGEAAFQSLIAQVRTPA